MESERLLRAEIIEQRGACSAGHKKGDVFGLSCYCPGGLCGYFYHGIFPNLQTYEFGGRLPWWRGEELVVTCPDPHNPVTLRITRGKA